MGWFGKSKEEMYEEELGREKRNYQAGLRNLRNPKHIEKLKREDKRYICKKCGYGWETKKKFGEPSICPNCKKNHIEKFSNTKGYEEEFQKEPLKWKEYYEGIKKDLKKQYGYYGFKKKD